MAKRKKSKKFFTGLAVYSAILLVLSVLVLVYVHMLLANYEACQPDNVAQKALASLEDAVKSGNGKSAFAFAEIGNPKFDVNTADFGDEYLRSLDGKTLTVKPGGRSYSGDMLTYDVFADGEKTATMMLEADKTTTRLIVFTTSDWKVTKIVPAMTVTTYSYSIKVPSDFTVSVNGVGVGEDELSGEESGFKTYEVKNLLSQPEFSIKDADGEEAYYNIESNVVTSVLFEYTVRLPESLALSVNGKTAVPVTADGMSEYKIIRAKKPTLTVTDGFGGSVTVLAGDEIQTYTHTVSVPEGYTVTLGGKTLEGGTVTDNPAYRYIAELGITVPKQMEYKLVLLTDTAAFAVTDENGAAVAATEKNGSLIISRKTNGGAMPAELMAEVDPAEIARTWSKFMTDDLTGNYHGFYEIAKYLKEGSYLYDVAYKWANSVDITFTSGHVLGNPPFENESVTNYTRFSDNCFSVDVHLVKVMHLDSGKTERDEMNATLYFVNDGKWYVADIIDIAD